MACSGNAEQLATFFKTRNSFQLHTGDINSWNELKCRAAGNSAEELAECIRLQIRRWHPLDGMVQNGHTVSPLCAGRLKMLTTTGNETLTLCDNMECDSSLKNLDRSDLKVTIKVFLRDATHGAEHIDQCLDSILAELETDSVEQLIVSFPQYDGEEKGWLQFVQPIWTRVEAICIDEQRALRVGVADLDLDELDGLRRTATRQAPVIDHYNIDACCEVPEELKDYAREHNVVLLTHNDPRDFLASDCLQNMAGSLGIQTECCAEWKPSWIGRYTVLINSRSVIIKKGYVVRFEKVCKKC